MGGPALLATLDALGEGVIDGEDAAVELCSVHVVHGGGGVLLLQESDEAEGAVLLGGLVERRLHVLYVPKRYECGVQYGLVHLLRKPSHVHRVLLHRLLRHSLSDFSLPCFELEGRELVEYVKLPVFNYSLPKILRASRYFF